VFERNSPRHSRSILCRIFCGALNDECLASYQNLVKHDLHRQICFWTWSLLDHFPSWPNGQLVGWKRACLCTTTTQKASRNGRCKKSDSGSREFHGIVRKPSAESIVKVAIGCISWLVKHVPKCDRSERGSQGKLGTVPKSALLQMIAQSAKPSARF